MGVVHASRGTLPPASPQLLSEVEIVCAIAQALFDASTLRLPRSADRRLGPIRPWTTPHPRRDQPGRAGIRRLQRPRSRRRAASSFRTARGTTDLRHRRRSGALHGQRTEPTPAPRPARCCSRRSAATTSTTPRSTASTTAIGASTTAGAWCSCQPDDLAARGLRDGDVVDLRSVDVDGVERVAPRFRVIEYPTPAGSCAAYYPETNVLVPLASADAAGTPTFKSIPIELSRPT